MKQMKLTIEDDDAVFLQVKGNIQVKDIIRVSAVLMAKAIKIGLEQNVIYESEVDDFYKQVAETSKRILAVTEWKEEEYERFAKAHHKG